MTIYHAFVDESGGVNVPGKRGWCLAVAAVVCDAPRPLELLMKRAFKQIGANPSVAEFKAAHSSDGTVRWMLQELIALDISIVVVTVDDASVRRMPKDLETVYRKATARVARLCVERWPHLNLVIDKRYTHEYLRRKLEWAIREESAGTQGHALVIRQDDSRRVRSLQVVDFVAWACWQHHHGINGNFYELIRRQIVAEEKLVLK